MTEKRNWHGRPTRLPDGEWGVRIQHFPATLPPRPGETVKVYTRRRGHWTARITAIEETSRLSVVRTTGPTEDIGNENLHEAEPPKPVAATEDDPLGALSETAETLHAAATVLRAARSDGEQAYLEVLSALYHAEDSQGNGLFEAHHILGFWFPGASTHALEGAARILEAAWDTLSGAKYLLHEIGGLDDFGEAKAASALRTAVARMDAAGLLEAAGDAIREAAVLLAAPGRPESGRPEPETSEKFCTLQQICKALRQALRNAPSRRVLKGFRHGPASPPSSVVSTRDGGSRRPHNQ